MPYTLKPFQRRALEASRNKLGFAHYLEMGLGKTLIGLHEFSVLASEKKVTRAVVLAPNTFKGGWQREHDTHGFDFETHVYRSSAHEAAERFVARGERDADGSPPRNPFQAPALLIANYDMVWRPKFRKLLTRFTKNRNVLLVCDESIYLKNPMAKRTKAVLDTLRSRQFSFVRLLSGRPSTQGPHDLWAQLTAIGCISEIFYAFRNRYCIMGGFERRQVVGIQNAPELQQRMVNHTIVLKKQDWLKELPPKSFTMREYRLTGIAAIEYARMEADFLAYIRDKKGTVIDTVEAKIAIAKFTKLLQLHAGFVHNEEGEPSWLVEDGDNARLQALLEVMDDEVEGKVIVCYKHQFVGEKLCSVMIGRHTDPAQIKGGMTPKKIQAEIDRFNRDPACRVMLLQLDAGKYGITLLGDQTSGENACRTMLFFENHFSLDTRAQIEDRIHRLGQLNPALYVDFYGSSMDYKVVAALQKKARLYEAIFGR